ncbi:hypothetical protein B0T10DRAFT_462573 [Thelonectria olida]|uniref:Uncharacterized protein n=1 Tax=Thelonectria olida TaxID=1576542 RepID=A0A9P8VZH2_9HYPO|nr:hypothetical protein B0T10DRAFT_462573 [Thelonectria olida]
MTDQEAYDASWDIPSAQTIPYGRGLIYLANVDAQIRTAFNGTENLDSLALDLLSICRTSSSECTEDELLMLLEKYVGPEAVEEYNEVSAGGESVIQPVVGSLGPCFDVVKTNDTTPVYQWVPKEGKNQFK